MTALQVKILLLKKGLTISEMANQLIEAGHEATFDSLRTMLTDLLYGRRYFPTLAEQVKDLFDIHIERPKHLQPVRESIKQNAA